jgi:predicted ABC-type ATPase
MPGEIYVIAGPNGIGKSTLSFDIIPRKIPIINSDEIALSAKQAGIIKSNTQEYSNREASRIIDEFMKTGQSFAMETNLADVETWKFLIKAQKEGYLINLIYLSTFSLDVLQNRIKLRAEAGEHFVRPDIVEERYYSSLKLLRHYFHIPDNLKLFDNTKSLKLIAEVTKNKQPKIFESLSGWAEEYLYENLHPSEKEKEKKVQDLNNVDEVRKLYNSKRK